VITRREVVFALGAGALGFPLDSIAQQHGTIPVLGILFSTSTHPHIKTIKQALIDRGYIEGKNLHVEWRFWEGNVDRIPGLVGELMKLKPHVILASTALPTREVMRVTKSTPIVFVGVGGDPVALGLIQSLARPGGNVSGVTHMANQLGGKQVQILHELLPDAAHLGVLISATNPNAAYLNDIEAAAARLRVKISGAKARGWSDYEQAFSALSSASVKAVLLQPDAEFFVQRQRIAALALDRRLPTISWDSQITEAGCLVSYGANLGEHFRSGIVYVDKVLKGAKPSDLPVEQSSEFNFVINMKTAKAIGVTVPQTILLRADRVIE